MEKNNCISYDTGMSSVKMNPGEKPASKKLQTERYEKRAFSLAHFSDPHLSSLAGVNPFSLLNKRLLGYLSWYRKRRHIHSPQVLEALLEDLAVTVPDHVVVTGDLTQLGLPDEFAQAARWLARLGPPEAVTVVPGNHDTYVSAPWQKTFREWEPYMVGDDHSRDPVFPSLRIRGPAALIGLSSARPSAPLLAVGSLGRTQLQRFEEILEETGRRGLLRIVLLHHPPVAGSIAWRKRLTDASLFADILARRGAELVLHGHAHRVLTRELVAGDRKIPVLGVPSASDFGSHPQRTACYHLYRIEKNADTWTLQLTVRRYCPDREKFLAADQNMFFSPMGNECK
jgi:3',5'-cyclic AMP phosphodiesterase CpdA